MNAVRRSLRPKHQTLVLKCYPKFHSKHIPGVKPNPSELSYLLFYASTKRSKLQKVGEFLEKKVTKDVSKGRINDIQVTLQILRALIEKCPRELSLYAGYVLNVLRAVVISHDVTTVEEAVATFGTFCEHQDPAMLAANSEYLSRYEQLLKLFSKFASRNEQVASQGNISVPVALRIRKAGLRAIKSVTSSDSINAETARQLAIILPPILENIYSDDGATHLKLLLNREAEKLEVDKEQAYKRRQSISTVRTIEEADADHAIASKTTEDADKLAEEETGTLAMQALKNVFTAVNRSQLRLATAPVLQFSFLKLLQQPPNQSTKAQDNQDNTWAIALFDTLCNWAPVQDRYIILFTVMEDLIRSPIAENDLARQVLLAMIIQKLLSSKINFIGLSVIDVLVGLIQHIFQLLKLDSQATMASHLLQQGANPEHLPESHQTSQAGGSTSVATSDVTRAVPSPSETRRQMLDLLEKCIASLATHVYYTDQVSDMISTLLLRLRPTAANGDAPGTTKAKENSGTVGNGDPPHSIAAKDDFFSIATARFAALSAAKNSLLVANSRSVMDKSPGSGRVPVPMAVWSSTQWLLRDSVAKVRTAYVDALLTWLEYETRKSDFQLSEPVRVKKDRPKSNFLVLRAASNASRKSSEPKQRVDPLKFLQLLHLAIYEHAHQFAESESDILLLHLLLTRLVEKLGINAARSGVPMVLRLQRDIESFESPNSRIHLGSLVYGYLWGLGKTFDFDSSPIGRAIHEEISRRNQSGLWLPTVTVPALKLSQFKPPISSPLVAAAPVDAFRFEGLRPFDQVSDLVTAISVGYTTTITSPPTSPPSSPNRSIALPAYPSSTLARPTSPRSPTMRAPAELPDYVKDDMISSWDKAEVLADAAKGVSRVGSAGHLRGKAGQFLTVAGNAQAPQAEESGADAHTRLKLPRQRPPSAMCGLLVTSAVDDASEADFGDDPTELNHNHFSAHSPMSARRASATASPVSNGSMRSSVHVEDLKRVLSGRVGSLRHLPEAVRIEVAEAESERAPSVNGSTDDAPTPRARSMVYHPRDSMSRHSVIKPGTSGGASAVQVNNPADPQNSNDDNVPPVPQLPSDVRLSLPPEAHPSPFPSLLINRSGTPSSAGGSSNRQRASGNWGEANLGKLLQTVEDPTSPAIATADEKSPPY